MKRILSLLLVLILTVSFTGCNNDSETSSETVKTETQKTENNYMTLLYSAADTFNPYDAKTESNRQLCRLLYEPLLKIDNQFNAVYALAKSVKVEGRECVVTLKDTTFTDGTKLTADDVVYSYGKAKKSNTSYATKLYGVESAKAVNSESVVFKLKKNDPYFANVLDFPIFKEKSDDIADSDSVKFPPIGCGRYKLNKDKTVLLQNEDYYGKKGSIKEIRLINAPDGESITHFVEIGAIDMYYSNIADGKILRMSGQKININLNNLIYIGVNHKNSSLSARELRQAISTGLNREKICKDAYYNNALAATGFFTPVWKEVKSLQNIQTTANSQITIENLEKIGYNELDKEGYRRKTGGALRFSLLVNEENSMRVAAAHLIKTQLNEYGIGITVVKLPYDKYLQRLKSGDFQLYLGEVKITENMDISNLVLPGGSAAFGINNPKDEKETEDKETKEKENTKKDIGYAEILKGFYKGQNSINDVVTSLQTDMPIIPLCYRTGVLFCNENIKNVKNSSVSDIYFSIESYNLKNK